MSAALLLGGSAAGLSTDPVSATGTGPAFRTSAVIGGGFMSVIAQAADGTFIAGGDTEGFFRSVDGGQTWTVQDAGLPNSGYRVAALLPLGSTWFAAVGDGTNGGIAESLDDGLTWSNSRMPALERPRSLTRSCSAWARASTPPGQTASATGVARRGSRWIRPRTCTR